MVSLTPTATSPSADTSHAVDHAERDDVGTQLRVDDRPQQLGDVLHGRRRHDVGRSLTDSRIQCTVRGARYTGRRVRREGDATVITLTDTAASKVKELLEAEGAIDLALRVAVRPGGCSGFSYEMFFDGDIAADDEQATFGQDDQSGPGRRRPGVGAAPRGRHARLQGRPQPGRVRHHEPERHAHLRLRPVVQLIPDRLAELRRQRPSSASTRSSSSAWSQMPSRRSTITPSGVAK